METSDTNRSEAIITATIGFCELGMWQEAWNELETLEPEERARPDVLGIRLGIYIALEKYESAAIPAEGMIARGDDSPHTWLQGAVAIRRHCSIEEARTFLLRAEPRLEGNATFQYTLATFECQLGNMPAAKLRLSRAIELNRDLQAMAVDDPDLWPMW